MVKILFGTKLLNCDPFIAKSDICSVLSTFGTLSGSGMDTDGTAADVDIFATLDDVEAFDAVEAIGAVDTVEQLPLSLAGDLILFKRSNCDSIFLA